MGKKILIICIIAFLALFALSIFNFANLGVNSPISTAIPFSSQNFDGEFTMNVPIGKHYEDIAYCLPNGELGCARQYCDDQYDKSFTDGVMVMYYYNNSLLVEGESNALEHALNGLTGTYLYHFNGNDGNLMIFQSSLEMSGIPPYLAGKSNDDGSKVVFVGGNDLKSISGYADSIEFSN